jgi:hypothetical protein
MGSLKCVDARDECDNTWLNETNNSKENNMTIINVNGQDYMTGSFQRGAVEGTLYRLEQRDIGRVQVQVRKNSLEAKRVFATMASR